MCVRLEGFLCSTLVFDFFCSTCPQQPVYSRGTGSHTPSLALAMIAARVWSGNRNKGTPSIFFLGGGTTELFRTCAILYCVAEAFMRSLLKNNKYIVHFPSLLF